MQMHETAEHQIGFPQGDSLHGWGPFGQRGPEQFRLAAAAVRRSPPGLRHPPASRLTWRLILMLSCAVLGAVQVPDAAEYSGREAIVAVGSGGEGERILATWPSSYTQNKYKRTGRADWLAERTSVCCPIFETTRGRARRPSWRLVARGVATCCRFLCNGRRR
ncbi:hypothetical protein DD237_007831 [Peronospora effusa]|uniref:Uncharacterized protein n=1 Tax=Peronospora effusa TaxID=542832 RepID=A0A425BXD3_9STRA|nr:hypothetical protein DD237_007831 [Peronospora effusa]